MCALSCVGQALATRGAPAFIARAWVHGIAHTSILKRPYKGHIRFQPAERPAPREVTATWNRPQRVAGRKT